MLEPVGDLAEEALHLALVVAAPRECEGGAAYPVDRVLVHARPKVYPIRAHGVGQVAHGWAASTQNVR
jgi:hypothetical protein